MSSEHTLPHVGRPPTTEVVQLLVNFYRLSRGCPVTGQFRFPGRGQRDTPIILVRDAVKLLQVTPGDAGDEVRARSSSLMCRVNEPGLYDVLLGSHKEEAVLAIC